MRNRNPEHNSLNVTEYLDLVAEHDKLESELKAILSDATAELNAKLDQTGNPVEQIAILIGADDALTAKVEELEVRNSRLHDEMHHNLGDHSGAARAELAGRRLEANVVLNHMFAKRTEKAAVDVMEVSPVSPRFK